MNGIKLLRRIDDVCLIALFPRYEEGPRALKETREITIRFRAQTQTFPFAPSHLLSRIIRNLEYLHKYNKPSSVDYGVKCSGRKVVNSIAIGAFP